MKRLGLQEIRREYLNFFASKEHLILPSFSLVPNNDKSLLLIGAGMAPMKKYFTGEATPPRTRVSTCQKCIRTGDIENVGKTDRHATFFEMLGNFSFGDYFKKEAIAWAWEFLTVNVEIDPEDLWVTVYLDDDEAYEIWNKEIGIPEEKIVRLGKEDNFWELEVGPSGPCSEIYVDRGEEHGCGDPNCKPGCDCDRFIEVWNLVFTQFDKDEAGVYHPLSNPNIDTGMGLERLATVLQVTDNIFEVDALDKIVRAIETAANYKYKTDAKLDESVRVITDHIRAITFLVSDSVRPGNEGREYVLRRLIRRAARHGRLLGIKKGFLAELSRVVVEDWGVEYTELIENKDVIFDVIRREEEKFLETLEQGMVILSKYIEELKTQKKSVLSGDKAFKLYDTYGFPVDLTKEILIENLLDIDIDGFEENMELQRQRARSAREDSNIGWSSHHSEELFKDLTNEFTGYEVDENETVVTGIFANETSLESASVGDLVTITLEKTPFYGESGGQVGDTGEIIGEDLKLKVLDTTKSTGELHLHKAEVVEGTVKVGSSVLAKIDSKRRNNIRRNHSVTHLLHKALKEVLGNHVNQAGSEVLENRMRFDFTHYEAISKEDLRKIEEKVNEQIFNSLPVETIISNPNEASEMGAIGLFEEKYKDEVRVIKMGDYSMELCGGTHVRNTAEISMFKILSENGISSGVRRIESITGPAVYNSLNNVIDLREKVASLLKSNKDEIINKLSATIENYKLLNKEIESLKLSHAKEELSSVLDSKVEIGSVNLVKYSFEDSDLETLRNIADDVRNKLGRAVVLLSNVSDGKLNFVCGVSKELNSEGIKAGDIIREVAKVTGGGGGGRPDMATAGGKDIEKLQSAFDKAEEILSNIVIN